MIACICWTASLTFAIFSEDVTIHRTPQFFSWCLFDNSIVVIKMTHTHSTLRVACRQNATDTQQGVHRHRILTTVGADDAQVVALLKPSLQEGAADIADGREQFSVRVSAARRPIDLKW